MKHVRNRVPFVTDHTDGYMTDAGIGKMDKEVRLLTTPGGASITFDSFLELVPVWMETRKHPNLKGPSYGLAAYQTLVDCAANVQEMYTLVVETCGLKRDEAPKGFTI